MTEEEQKEAKASYGSATGPIVAAEPYEVPGMSLSRKHWNRLKEEADEAKMGWTEIWLGAAFAFFGIGGAAWIAFWALPGSGSADPHATQLSSGAQDVLRLIGIFSLIVAVVCFLAWIGRRRDHNASLDRLIRNMGSHEHDA